MEAVTVVPYTLSPDTVYEEIIADITTRGFYAVLESKYADANAKSAIVLNVFDAALAYALSTFCDEFKRGYDVTVVIIYWFGFCCF